MKPGHYIFEHLGRDQVRVQLTYLPSQKLEVAIWWNNRLSQPDVLLFMPLHNSLIEFGDLTGNGYGCPLHRVGVGTFVVNTAIQVLRLTYDPSTRVIGKLSNPTEDHHNDLKENRRIFWSRFGLNIGTSAPNQYEPISGTVENLRTIAYGMVAGQFPRLLPLSKFTYEGL